MSMSRSSLKKSKRLFSSEMLPNHVISISPLSTAVSCLEETISLNRNSFKLYLKLYVDIRLFRLPWLEVKKRRRRKLGMREKQTLRKKNFFIFFFRIFSSSTTIDIHIRNKSGSEFMTSCLLHKLNSICSAHKKQRRWKKPRMYFALRNLIFLNIIG
jgi:hypothetical protein